MSFVRYSITRLGSRLSTHTLDLKYPPRPLALQTQKPKPQHQDVLPQALHLHNLRSLLLRLNASFEM